MLAVLFTVGAGEIALRLLYLGGARRTLSGPGGGYFDSTTIDGGDLRAPMNTRAKAPGVRRIVIQGDSITWGLGVHEWRQTYPNLLQNMLDARGARFDMAVFAEPGREIDAHLKAIRRMPATTEPDILVYQWYVNDIEVVDRRPDATRVWQRWPTHKWLKAHSYLYFFLDWRFSTLLPPPQRSYPQFLLDEFKDGSTPWSEFRWMFHNWAVNAASRAPRRILLMYPLLPFKGTYALQPIHDRVKALARPHTFVSPIYTFDRRTGNSPADPSATFTYVRRHEVGERGGWLFLSPQLALGRGHHVLRVRLREDGASEGTLGRFEIVRGGEAQVLVARRDISATDFDAVGTWKNFDVAIDVTEDIVQDLELRLGVSEAAPISADTVSLDVDYGLEVVDPIDELNTFNTHASLFDAHPNARAHHVLAEALARVIQ